MYPDNYRRLIRLPEVMARTGLSRAWIYKACADGRFVKFHKIGRATVFDAAAVDAWIGARLAASNGETR